MQEEEDLSEIRGEISHLKDILKLKDTLVALPDCNVKRRLLKAIESLLSDSSYLRCKEALSESRKENSMLLLENDRLNKSITTNRIPNDVCEITVEESDTSDSVRKLKQPIPTAFKAVSIIIFIIFIMRYVW